jgi:hypothetical protein
LFKISSRVSAEEPPFSNESINSFNPVRISSTFIASKSVYSSSSFSRLLCAFFNSFLRKFFVTADLFDYLTAQRIKNYGEIIVLVGGGTKPTSIALFYAALYLYRNYDDVKVRTYYLNYSPIEKIEFDFEKQRFQSKHLVIKRTLKLKQIFEILVPLALIIIFMVIGF